MRGGSPVMQIRLRTPTVCAPSSSDWMPRMLRSRQQKWLHGFDAGLLLDELAGDLRAHAGAGARAVGHVDAVDAVLRRSSLAPVDFAGGVHAARRQDLHEGHEFPGRQLGAQLAISAAIGTGGRACALASGSSTVTPSFLLQRLQRARFRADQLDVLGRGAAAAADDLHARPQHAPRVLRHVLGRAEIDVAALHAQRAGRRWAWRSWAWWRTASCARWFRAWPWGPPSS